jgi:hypothetical protein
VTVYYADTSALVKRSISFPSPMPPIRPRPVLLDQSRATRRIVENLARG